MLTRQRDFSGDLDGRTDQRAAFRSQNIRLVDFAGSRGGCSGNGRARVGRRARHDRRGGDDASGDLADRCRGHRGNRLSINDFGLGLAVNGNFLRELRFDAKTGERSGTGGAQTKTHLRQKIALGASLF